MPEYRAVRTSFELRQAAYDTWSRLRNSTIPYQIYSSLPPLPFTTSLRDGTEEGMKKFLFKNLNALVSVKDYDGSH